MIVETVVGGLILAAVSALTWIAYRHPKQFPRFFHPVLWCICTAYVGIVAISVAKVFFATGMLVHYLESSPDGAIKFVGLEVQDLKWARDALVWGAIIGGAAAGYLLLLLYLPNILELDQGKPNTMVLGGPGDGEGNSDSRRDGGDKNP